MLLTLTSQNSDSIRFGIDESVGPVYYAPLCYRKVISQYCYLTHFTLDESAGIGMGTNHGCSCDQLEHLNTVHEHGSQNPHTMSDTHEGIVRFRGYEGIVRFSYPTRELFA